MRDLTSQRIESLDALAHDLLTRVSKGKLRWVDAFGEIDKHADETIDSLIADTSEGNYGKLIEIIHGRREKLPLDTGLTDRVLGISLNILAFGAAGLALAIGFIDKISALSLPVRRLLAVGGVFYAELVILSLVFIVLFLLYAHFRYPFHYLDRIGNTWPWYYSAAISKDVPRSPFTTGKALLLGGQLYARDLVTFADRALDETPAQQLRNELQQYFLLISYQGYINQFALRSTNVFLYGVVGCLATAVVLAIRAVVRR